MIQVHSSAASWGERNTVKQFLMAQLLVSSSQVHGDGGLTNGRGTEPGLRRECPCLGSRNTLLPRPLGNWNDGNSSGGRESSFLFSSSYKDSHVPRAATGDPNPNRTSGHRPGPLPSCEEEKKKKLRKRAQFCNLHIGRLCSLKRVHSSIKSCNVCVGRG